MKFNCWTGHCRDPVCFGATFCPLNIVPVPFSPFYGFLGANRKACLHLWLDIVGLFLIYQLFCSVADNSGCNVDKGARWAVLFLCPIVTKLLRFLREMWRNEAPRCSDFQIKSQICVARTTGASSCLPRLCLFSFRYSFFCLGPLLGFRTYYVLSLFSNLSYFPLELSLHTIANNPAKELHLCSWAFSINPHLSPFFF